jgi:UDP-N-acetylmuramoyl-tripeptide--D-alanyl-D-alanine ligase
MKLNLPGLYNVSNSLAAITTALCGNIGINEIKSSMENFKLPKMHTEIKQLGSNIQLINDAYNANPGSMISSLSWFITQHVNERKIVVLGDMLELGNTSRSEHVSLGKFINDNGSKRISQVYLYGPEISAAANEIKSVETEHFTGTDELIKTLLVQLKPNTSIFFKASRGISLEKVIARLITAYDAHNTHSAHKGEKT